jgi:hypothetical protein
MFKNIYTVSVEKLFISLVMHKIYNNTRSYYRKESAASPPRDQRQHAQFAE